MKPPNTITDAQRADLNRRANAANPKTDPRANERSEDQRRKAGQS